MGQPRARSDHTLPFTDEGTTWALHNGLINSSACLDIAPARPYQPPSCLDKRCARCSGMIPVRDLNTMAIASASGQPRDLVNAALKV